MNSRRKFLKQGSMASTALLLAKPFETFANRLSPALGFSNNYNKIFLVHTGNLPGSIIFGASKLAVVKKNTPNALLLHTGTQPDHANQLSGFDASLHAENKSGSSYRIIYKGDVKIGIIGLNDTISDPVSHVNNTAAYLKNNRECNLVVCLSALGYKNKSGIDDQGLASLSRHIDVIICGHQTNFPKYPMILHNAAQEEVIVHASSSQDYAFGNMEISFDERKVKRQIDFDTLHAA